MEKQANRLSRLLSVTWILITLANLGIFVANFSSLASYLDQGGFGVILEASADSKPRIRFGYPGSPASQAGLPVGGTILQVDGAPARLLPGTTRLEGETGEPGKSTVWIVDTPADDPRSYLLTRHAGWHDTLLIGALLANIPIKSFAASLLAMEAILALVFITVANLIFWPRPGDRMRLLAALALQFSGANLTTSSWYARQGFLDFPQALPGEIANIWFAFGSILIYLFLLASPDGRFVPRWSWPFAGLLAVLLLDSNFFTILPATPAFLLEMALFLLAVGFQTYRYLRASTPTQRQQTKWIVVGLSAALLAGFAFGAFWELFLQRSNQPWMLAAYLDSFGNLVIRLTTLVVPICLAFAVQKHRLWDIDALINRTMVYTVLTFTLASLYYISVVLLQEIFVTLTSERQSDIVAVISTLGVSTLFAPLRRRIQDSIDQRFYRRKYNSIKTLATFGKAVRTEVDLYQLTRQLLGLIEETIQPAHVSLWLRDLPDGATSRNPDRHRPGILE